MPRERRGLPRSPSRVGAANVPPDVAALVLAICHEVGNLLAAARLSAHLAAREPSAPDLGPTLIEDLAAQAGALLAQVRPLLGGSPAKVRVAPEQLLQALERALAERAHGEVHLEVKIPRALPDVDLDPDAFYHALLMLTLVALESVRPSGRVRVSAQRADGGVTFAVEDDARAPEPEPRPRRGRGLALELMRRVAQRCGGKATLRPRRRGTRIEIWFGAAKATRRTARPAGPGVRRGVTRPGAAPKAAPGAADGPAARGGPRPARRRPGHAARST